MGNKKYIYHAPYLRNSIAYDHDFWCTCVKMMITPGGFLSVLFFNFDFLDFLRGGGSKRAENSLKWKIMINPSRVISRKQYSIWSWFLLHLWKLLISADLFCIFSKFGYLGVVSWVKRQQIAQNEKKFWYVALHLSGTIQKMIVIRGTLRKMTISPGVFILSKLWFSGLFFWSKGAEYGPKWEKKNFVPLGTIHYMIFIFGTHVCLTVISPTIFFIF